MHFFSLLGAETPIPTTNPDNNWSDNFNPFGQFFLAVIVFVVVLFLAYYFTKFMARSRLPRKGSNFELIDSMTIGQTSAIQIVRVGKKYILIGITKENINALDYLSEDDIDLESSTQTPISFDKYFSSALKKGSVLLKRGKKSNFDDKDGRNGKNTI